MNLSALPAGWAWVTLAEIAAQQPNAIVDGPFGSSLKLSDYVETGVPVLQGKNITNDRFRWFDVRFISEVKANELRRSATRVGDVLIVKIGSIGYSAVVNSLHGFEFAIIPANLAKLTPDPGRIDTSYLHHWMRTATVKTYLQSSASKTAQPALSLGKIRELPLPLPPLPEQGHIAAILDKADALRAKRREALAQLDSLAQSIFSEMFGAGSTGRNAWQVRRLDEVTECLDRLRRPVTESQRKPGEIPYYGANGQQGWIDTHLFDEPLVLVAEDGGHFENPSRGVAYRVDGKSWVNNHAHILRPKPDLLDIEYLHRALKHFDFTPYISGTTRAKLTQGQLNSIPLLVPPITAQRAFARRIHRLQGIQKLHQESMGELDALFASLQHRAFTGQLS